MKTILLILVVLLFSCSENNKTINTKELSSVSNEIKYQNILDSIKLYKLKPFDTLQTHYKLGQLENHKIADKTIKIFKRDSLNINWIKINSDKYMIDSLKLINSRTGEASEIMFANSLNKIKLYQFKDDEILLMQFTSFPCTGLGCSVTDYIIYSFNKKKLNLFGSFRSENIDLYNFPLNSDINYIATEYRGDYHGATPMHFISRVYSMNENGRFYQMKDINNKDYYYEITRFPNDTLKEVEYRVSWF